MSTPLVPSAADIDVMTDKIQSTLILSTVPVMCHCQRRGRECCVIRGVGYQYPTPSTIHPHRGNVPRRKPSPDRPANFVSFLDEIGEEDITTLLPSSMDSEHGSGSDIEMMTVCEVKEDVGKTFIFSQDQYPRHLFTNPFGGTGALADDGLWGLGIHPDNILPHEPHRDNIPRRRSSPYGRSSFADFPEDMDEISLSSSSRKSFGRSEDSVDVSATVQLTPQLYLVKDVNSNINHVERSTKTDDTGRIIHTINVCLSGDAQAMQADLEKAMDLMKDSVHDTDPQAVCRIVCTQSTHGVAVASAFLASKEAHESDKRSLKQVLLDVESEMNENGWTDCRLEDGDLAVVQKVVGLQRLPLQP